MCGGSSCKRCGGWIYSGGMEHRRGCALPHSAVEAIRRAGVYLPDAAVEAAIAAAEDTALELRGVQGMRELRAEDQAEQMRLAELAAAQQRLISAGVVVQGAGVWTPSFRQVQTVFFSGAPSGYATAAGAS